MVCMAVSVKSKTSREVGPSGLTPWGDCREGWIGFGSARLAWRRAQGLGSKVHRRGVRAQEGFGLMCIGVGITSDTINRNLHLLAYSNPPPTPPLALYATGA